MSDQVADGGCRCYWCLCLTSVSQAVPHLPPWCVCSLSLSLRSNECLRTTIPRLCGIVS